MSAPLYACRLSLARGFWTDVESAVHLSSALRYTAQQFINASRCNPTTEVWSASFFRTFSRTQHKQTLSRPRCCIAHPPGCVMSGPRWLYYCWQQLWNHANYRLRRAAFCSLYYGNKRPIAAQFDVWGSRCAARHRLHTVWNFSRTSTIQQQHGRVSPTRYPPYSARRVDREHIPRPSTGGRFEQ